MAGGAPGVSATVVTESGEHRHRLPAHGDQAAIGAPHFRGGMPVTIRGVLGLDEVFAPVQGGQLQQRLHELDGPGQRAAHRRFLQKP